MYRYSSYDSQFHSQSPQVGFQGNYGSNLGGSYGYRGYRQQQSNQEQLINSQVKRIPVQRTYIEQLPETTYITQNKTVTDMVPQQIMVPVERTVQQQVPKTVYRDVQRDYTDYIEYVEETRQRAIPRTETYTEMIPQTKTRTVYDYQNYTTTKELPGTVGDRTGVTQMINSRLSDSRLANQSRNIFEQQGNNKQDYIGQNSYYQNKTSYNPGQYGGYLRNYGYTPYTSLYKY